MWYVHFITNGIKNGTNFVNNAQNISNSNCVGGVYFIIYIVSVHKILYYS
jgi:hypothetical protein